MVNDYWCPKIVKSADISQRGLFAANLGKSCEIWKDWHLEK